MHAARGASRPSGIGQVDGAGTARFDGCDPTAFRVTMRSPTARSWTPAPTSAIVPAARYPTTCARMGAPPRRGGATRDQAVEVLRAWDREQPGRTRTQRQYQAWQRGTRHPALSTLQAFGTFSDLKIEASG